MARFLKDPSATLDYQVNWAAWLGSDTIQTSTWITDDGITISNQASTATTATVWLAGGTINQAYMVTNRIVTVGGRTEDRSFQIVIAER